MKKLTFAVHPTSGAETFAYILQGKTVLGAGVAIKNPEDSYDLELAEKTAMRRACQAAAVRLYLVNGNSAKKTIQQLERDLYHDFRKRTWEARNPERVMEVKRILEPAITAGNVNTAFWSDFADAMRRIGKVLTGD